MTDSENDIPSKWKKDEYNKEVYSDTETAKMSNRGKVVRNLR